MVTAANCDLLIYGGGESDQWLTKLEATNPNRETLVLLPLLGAAGSPGGSGGLWLRRPALLQRKVSSQLLPGRQCLSINLAE